MDNNDNTVANAETPAIVKEIVVMVVATVAVTAATFATIGALSLALTSLDDRLTARRQAKLDAKYEKSKKH
jgi:hypothetical protein